MPNLLHITRSYYRKESAAVMRKLDVKCKQEYTFEIANDTLYGLIDFIAIIQGFCIQWCSIVLDRYVYELIKVIHLLLEMSN